MTTKTVTKPEPNHNSKFWIHPDDFDKIIAYAQASYDEFSAEIGGQLIVSVDEEGDFMLHNPEIMKQTVSGGECNLDAAELGQYYCKQAKKYGDDVRFCWWHSHHTMGAFWSGTDDHTILTNPSKDWTLSLVVNLKREYKLRIQFFKPFLHEVNVELNMMTVDNDISKAIIDEVKEKCAKEAPIVKSYAKGSQQNVFGFANNDLDAYGYDYGGYGNYNSYTKTTFNKAGIPVKVLKEAEDDVEAIVEELTIIHGNEALKFFNENAEKLNKQYEKYNFRIALFDNAPDLERAVFGYWADDWFENLTEGVKA